MAGELRITGGKLVRQKISVPEDADKNLVRPATDRVREAIFSSLQHDMPGATVLDIFAGSGAYSFESVSRGAQSAVMIEKSTSTAACIKQNIQKLKLETQCKLIQADALKFISGKSGEIFSLKPDIIFLDPPYTLSLPITFWDDLNQWLHPESLIVFRCHAKKDFVLPENFKIIREKKYGGTWVAFLVKI